MTAKKKGRGLVRFLSSLMVFVALLSLCLVGPAEAKKETKTKKKKSKAPTQKVVSAPKPSNRYAALVIEAQTGRILMQSNAGAKRHPASLTKMMTLYLAFQAIENGVIRLETQLPVSTKAANQSPSKLGLRAGQTITAYDAIMGLVTESANDAAVVLAEALGGNTDAFADMMVQQARALGMRGTVFENPNGLPDPDQVTTARDMAMLGYALIYHYPGFYPYFSRESFSYKGRVHRNHNHLMERYTGMDGIKTGYIRASGFNLVASATRGETRLIGVIFGGTSAPSRDKKMEALLNDGFALIRREPQSKDSDDFLPLPSKVAVAFGGRKASGTTKAAAAQTSSTSSSSSKGRTVAEPAAPVAPASPAQVLVPPPSAIAAAQEQQQREAPAVITGAVDGWGIQVGAFSDVNAAQQALSTMGKSMASLLGNAEQSLQKITLTDGSAMYRARFMGLDQSAARSACAYMVKRGQGCLVVSGP